MEHRRTIIVSLLVSQFVCEANN